jgi:hypothetical protein
VIMVGRSKWSGKGCKVTITDTEVTVDYLPQVMGDMRPRGMRY